MNISETFKKYGIEVFYSLSAALLVILIPLVVILFLPIYIFRYCVQFGAWIWIPEPHSMLSMSGPLMASDDIYTSPKNAIVVYTAVRGVVDENLGESLLLKLIDIKNENGKPAYPELKQHLTKWCGFFFWKQVKNFNIKNHYKVYSDKEVQEKELCGIISNWISEPFPKYQSPWCFLVIPNFKAEGDSSSENKVAVLMRLHHSISDGFSFLKALNRMTDEPAKVVQPEGSMSKKRTWFDILTQFGLTPYRIVKHIATSTDTNALTVQETSNELSFAMPRRIPVALLKEIKDDFNVGSISTVIMAAFAGTLRRAMLKGGYEIPKFVHCAMPFPIPGHPDDVLANYVGWVMIKLPIGIAKPEERLQIMQDILLATLKDLTPLVVFRLRGIVGNLFHLMIPSFFANDWTTLNASFLPGPKREITIGDRTITDTCYFIPRTSIGSTGIGMYTLTYNGYIRLALGIENNLLAKMSNPSVVDIAAGFEQELYLFKSIAQTSAKSKDL